MSNNQNFNYQTYINFRENHGWDDAISYLETLQEHNPFKPFPNSTEINCLIGMYWQAYSLTNADDPDPDAGTCYEIRNFCIQQIDSLLTIDTLVHIDICMPRKLTSDDEFRIEQILSKELDAKVTVLNYEERPVWKQN